MLNSPSQGITIITRTVKPGEIRRPEGKQINESKSIPASQEVAQLWRIDDAIDDKTTGKRRDKGTQHGAE